LRIATSLYRVALFLYPPAFREEFGDEMLLDFADARQEAVSASSRVRRSFWWAIAFDLCRSIVWQWLRTGMPLIGLTAMLCSSCIVLALICFWRWAAPMVVQVGSADVDVLLSVLLTGCILLLVSGTLVFSTWFTRTTRRRREF
jgi:hypothetical protein